MCLKPLLLLFASVLVTCAGCSDPSAPEPKAAALVEGTEDGAGPGVAVTALDAPTAEALGTITFRVTDLEGTAGVVVVRLFRGPEGFPGETEASVRMATVAIVDGQAAGSFTDVPHGEYALWACHDEDEDGELDTNFIGMPKEGVGVSGPKPKFMPSYEGARFVLDSARTEQAFGMVYL